MNLFDGKCINGQKDYEQICPIIVKKTSYGVMELLTGYRLSVFPTLYLHSSQVNEKKIHKCGHHPFISKQQLVQRNLATPEDIEQYVDEYEDSQWKKIYDELKIFTIAQKVVIKQRTKTLYKSKKE